MGKNPIYSFSWVPIYTSNTVIKYRHLTWLEYNLIVSLKVAEVHQQN